MPADQGAGAVAGGGLVGAGRRYRSRPHWKDNPAVADLVADRWHRGGSRSSSADADSSTSRNTAGEQEAGPTLQLLVAGCSMFWTRSAAASSRAWIALARRQKELADRVREDNEKLRALQADAGVRSDSGASR